jgi:GDP-L-fucose synthase
MFHNKKVLVTGGAGFVGVNLIKRLLSEGAIVRSTLYIKDEVLVDNRIEYIRVDLRNEQDCFTVTKDIDYVFMCAANTSGANVIENTPMVHLTPNVIMNMQMLQAAYSENVKKFLFISSNVVYPLVDFPVKETDVLNEFYESYHIVAWMKRFSELVCDMYSTHIKPAMQTVIVRPGNLYGPYDKFDWEKSKVIPAIIRRAVERQNPLTIWGDGKDLKDFIYIDDFIDGLLLAMEKLEGNNPVNIASGNAVTINQVINEILIASSYQNAELNFDQTKPKMIPKRMINIDFARQQLGFNPKVPLREGIQKTISWYKTYYKDKKPDEKY